MLSSSTLLALILIISTIFFLRLLQILPLTNRTPPPRKRGTPTRLLIILGSGGHTAEMTSLLSDLDTASYTHRSYVISTGDDFSARKAIDLEESLEARAKHKALYSYFDKVTYPEFQDTAGQRSYDISFIPRARNIHQSLLSTPFSSLRSLVACFSILRYPSTSPQSPAYPDLILTNGPGTSVILVLASILLRFLDVPGTRGKMRTIYVESWARVKGLSLSGRILVQGGLVNRCLVQWEGLKGKGEYIGVLVR
ncbi:UDP-N-acetylglucosamine transferase subunit [Toensbergia leucococca]|nr:UDP-N-acetylglucosamine transferase subunit [Toensbergia leucococca]